MNVIKTACEADLSYLEAVLERPDIRRKIVQGYVGAYTLGITRLSDRYAILFRVEEPPREIPDIVVDGKKVPVVVVVVRDGFRPRPLAHQNR